MRGNSNEFTISGELVPDTPKTVEDLQVRDLNNRLREIRIRKDVLETEIFNETSKDVAASKRRQVAAFTQEISSIIDQLRLVSNAKTILDVPCRLYSPADKPQNHSLFTPKDMDHSWMVPSTYLKSGDYTIKIIDNNQQAKCPEGYLLLEAQSSTGQKASACIQNSVDAAKVNLIINDNGLTLKEVRYGIVEPLEQGMKYELPSENYHGPQGDFAENPDRLRPQVSDFSKAN
jgi:hypothetical protein